MPLTHYGREWRVLLPLPRQAAGTGVNGEVLYRWHIVIGGRNTSYFEN